MPQSLVSFPVHVIFSTKQREPTITDNIRDRLFQYMGGIWSEHCGVPILINGPADHVHILAMLSSTCTIADAMRLLKTNSSKWIHETFRHERFAWQAGYGAFAVSASNVDAVRQYIATQQERHATVTFQDEYRAFLRRHGIAFDERYVWD